MRQVTLGGGRGDRMREFPRARRRCRAALGAPSHVRPPLRAWRGRHCVCGAAAIACMTWPLLRVWRGHPSSQPASWISQPASQLD
eukprot:359310-Chlamydomonas_euryale.AAC.3